MPKLETKRLLGEASHNIMKQLIIIAVLLTAWPLSSQAGGQRDLDDGIAFYENLDTDRALERLTAAGNASDLNANKRAIAWMYVGVIHFELGDKNAAKIAWTTCFSIDAKAKAPDGISPKMVEAVTLARVEAKSNPTATTPGIGKPDSKADTEAGGVTKPKPDPAKDKLPGVKLNPVSPDDSSALTKIFGPDFDWLLWGSVGGGVALAAIVAVVVIAVNSNSNECQGESGGCILVSYSVQH